MPGQSGLIFILKACWLLVFMYPALHLFFSAPGPCVDVTIGLDFSPKVPASLPLLAQPSPPLGIFPLCTLPMEKEVTIC